MAIIKQGCIVALLGLALISITGCVRVMPGDPPVMTLMKADKVNFEGNPRAMDQYDAALTEIFLHTTADGLDPNAGADEEPKIVNTILKTRDVLRKKGTNISALELSREFVRKMPSDQKKYELDSIKNKILASY